MCYVVYHYVSRVKLNVKYLSRRKSYPNYLCMTLSSYSLSVKDNVSRKTDKILEESFEPGVN